VWPKKPDSFVPYSQQDTSVDDDRTIWEREKRAFLDRVAHEGTYLTPDQVDALRALDYREFLARYHGDQQPGVPGLYSSGGGMYVGHVGIVDVAPGGSISIIEALWEKGVVRHSYKDWLAGRQGELVWLGRLRERSATDRAKISAEAAKYLQRPYVFWNFDLNDDSGFYCSKLAWMAIFRSLGLAVDGDDNPRRRFWFSPKQLLYLPGIDHVHEPGHYA
jgi:hypothetical protein